MKVLVAYATRHGATRSIAERVAQVLDGRGIGVTVEPAGRVRAVTEYDAFVVGSAAYMTRWLKEATDFAHRFRTALASHPTWLFSSGPVGDRVDRHGRDVTATSQPREFAELRASIHPRDEHVFFGALNPDAEPIGLAEKLAHSMPASWRAAMPTGDYRDWNDIDAWADGIATELQRTGAPAAR